MYPQTLQLASLLFIFVKLQKLIRLMSFHPNFVQFLCACEPITCLAYIFDGLHYGVSDFSYIAFTTVNYTPFSKNLQMLIRL